MVEVHWRCRKCGCVYAVGLSMCPQCTSTDHEEADMPKISEATGASNAGLSEERASSPGISSSTSSGSSETPPSGETTSKPRSAPTTENPSEKPQTEGSTAPSTGTGRRGRVKAGDSK